MDAALSLRCRRGMRLVDVERACGFVLQAERTDVREKAYRRRRVRRPRVVQGIVFLFLLR